MVFHACMVRASLVLYIPLPPPIFFVRSCRWVLSRRSVSGCLSVARCVFAVRPCDALDDEVVCGIVRWSSQAVVCGGDHVRPSVLALQVDVCEAIFEELF